MHDDIGVPSVPGDIVMHGQVFSIQKKHYFEVHDLMKKMKYIIVIGISFRKAFMAFS